MKVGDLVSHTLIHDLMIGIIISREDRPFVNVHWFDGEGSTLEVTSKLEVVNEAR